MCIGFSPATDAEAHARKYGCPTEGFSELVFIPKTYPHAGDIAVCRKYRNVASIAVVDMAIIIGGRIGTMNEFTIAYDLGKKIGLFENSGGVFTCAINAFPP